MTQSETSKKTSFKETFLSSLPDIGDNNKGKVFKVTIWASILLGLIYLVTSELPSFQHDSRLFALSWIVSASISFLYALIVYSLDKHEKEPLKLLLDAFLWGAIVSTALSGIIRTYLMANPGMLAAFSPEVWVTVNNVAFTPILEETTKGFVLLLLLFLRKNEFDDVLDGIIYGAFVGLGFAFVENARILFSAGITSGMEAFTALYGIRVVLGSLVGHVTYSALLGMGIGYLKGNWTNPVLRKRALVLAFVAYLLSIISHGLWNGFVMPMSIYLSIALIGLPFLALVILGVRFGWRREADMIATELKEEVKSGVLSNKHLKGLLVGRIRLKRSIDIWLKAGLTRLLLKRKHQQQMSELAFRKWHLHAEGLEIDGDQLVKEYRKNISELSPALSAEKLSPGRNLRLVVSLVLVLFVAYFFSYNFSLAINGLEGLKFSNFDTRFLLNSQGPGSQRISDVDQDGLSDDLEYYLATQYAPLLEFDEGEDENVWVTLLPLYQVTPAIHASGQYGAMLVFTFLYDGDYGADFDRKWSDWVTDPGNAACGSALDPFDHWFGQHAGDTEVIYFFIAGWNDWSQTQLYSIFWKRHYDPIYETNEWAVEYSDFGTGGNPTHPMIYVSEDKHGMYPSHDECEDYQTDVLWEKANIPCWPKMEDCSDGGTMMIMNLPSQWNVGEVYSSQTRNSAALNGTIYQGMDPWLNDRFWGRTDYQKIYVDDAGGLGGKWCGTPFYGDDHPCAGPNWHNWESPYWPILEGQ